MKQPANYHIEKIYAIRLCTATVLSLSDEPSGHSHFTKPSEEGTEGRATRLSREENRNQHQQSHRSRNFITKKN